jgi:glycosyltransferase involved in cell wall biosynthesis
MRRVLWLCSWYPNAADPFTGDFIKRQAEALSVIQPLKIIFAGKYPRTPQQQKGSGDRTFTNLEEVILYYPFSSSYNSISKIRSLFAYFKKHRDYFHLLKKNNELPDVVHVHVAFRAGLIALYLKWKYKIPYVLTEHWTGYYRDTKDSLFNKSYLEKYLVRLILKHTDLLITVSEALGNQIQENWIRVPFRKMPNVVDTRFFYPREIQPGKRFRFIHISSFQNQKNPEAIVRVFMALVNEGIQAELVMVGPVGPDLEKMVTESGLPPGIIQLTGEISYEQVAVELGNSSVLVLFSFYENMPCVILESLCSGIPVIATGVGGIPEVIGNENGILVDAGDERELLGAMKQMMGKASLYDKEKISRKATAAYSYETVARQIMAVYDELLSQD